MTRLSWVSLAAALILTAQAEWTLALAVGWWIYVAWCWPLAVDLYVVASFRAHRDRAWAIGLMAASVAGAHALPRLFPDGMPPLVAGAMSVVPVLVAWRVHEMPAARLTGAATPTITVTSLAPATPTPTNVALEEPRTHPAPTADTPGTSTPPTGASQPAPSSSPASRPARASSGGATSGRSGGRRPAMPLAEAFAEVAADLAERGRAVNYKNVAPGLRRRGHPAGRAKVDALIAEHAKPKLQAV